MVFSKQNIFVKIVIWGVVTAFVLSIFLFAGMFRWQMRQEHEQAEKLREMDTTRVKPADAEKPLATLEKDDGSLKMTVTVGQYFDFLHQHYKPETLKMQSRPEQRKQLLDQMLQYRLYEYLRESVAVTDAEYQAEAARLKKQGVDFKTVGEKNLRAYLKEKKLAESLLFKKEVSDEAAKDYYEKHRSEFQETVKDKEGKEIKVEKPFEQVKAQIKARLSSEITEDDIKAVYEKHKYRFMEPKEVEFSQIFIKEPSEKRIAEMKPQPDDIKTVFENNYKEFLKPRELELLHIVLDPENEKWLSKVNVPEEQIKEYYEKHKDEYRAPRTRKVKVLYVDARSPAILEKATPSTEQIKKEYERIEKVRASHILVDSETLAIELHRRARAGEDFGKLAEEFSKCPSKTRGGDLQEFGRGQMVPEFEEVAFSLESGEIAAKPVKTQFGWHVIKGTGRKRAYEQPLDEVKEEITRKLLEDNCKKLAKERAEEAFKKLEKETFEIVMKEYSDPVKATEVELKEGKYEKEDYSESIIEEFGENGRLPYVLVHAAFQGELGKPSEIVETEKGCYILLPVAENPERTLELEEARSSVIRAIQKNGIRSVMRSEYANIRSRLDTGEEFEKLAGELSDAPSAKKGGYIGRVSLGEIAGENTELLKEEKMVSGTRLHEELSIRLAALDMNDVSELIEAGGVFHIFKVKDVTEQRIPKLEEVLEKVTEMTKKIMAERESRKIAEEARKELLSGKPFAEVARRLSEGKTKEEGGKIGTIKKGMPLSDAPKVRENMSGEGSLGWALFPAIEEAVFGLGEGEISDIITSPFGFHIIRVDRVIPGKIPELEKVKDRVREMITTRMMVTDAEIRENFEARKEEFTVPEKINIRHIVVKDEKLAEELLRRVKGGENFANLAKAHSIDSNRDKGGEIGFVPRGQLAKELDDIVWGMKIGEYGPVVKTKMGYHVFQVIDKKEREEPSLTAKYEEIKEELLRPKLNQLRNDLVEEHMNRCRIKYYRENFELLTKYN